MPGLPNPYSLLGQLRRIQKFAFSPYPMFLFTHPRLGRGLSRGRFRSFEEAEASVPKAVSGYDNEAMKDYYGAGLDPALKTLHARDYPVLFHLSRLLREGSEVFDLGGNVGNHFYLYRHHLPLDRITWTVGEVQAISEIGARLAREHGASNLRFTSDLSGMSGCEALICQGSIQYFKEFPPPGVSAYPRHLIVNRQPLAYGEGFVTMQNGGKGVFYPQRIYNRDAFLSLIADLGYRLEDEWTDHDDEIMLPFLLRSVGYFGFKFVRA